VAEGSDRVDGDAAVEIDQPALYADAQERKVSELETTVGQLQSALDSRVVIERATGILAERFDLTVSEAFELLRSAARSSRRRVSELAREMTESRGWTPDEIVIARRRRDLS
jgi:AmiR/NasT family two-component response regulator